MQDSRGEKSVFVHHILWIAEVETQYHPSEFLIKWSGKALGMRLVGGFEEASSKANMAIWRDRYSRAIRLPEGKWIIQAPPGYHREDLISIPPELPGAKIRRNEINIFSRDRKSGECLWEQPKKFPLYYWDCD